MKLMHLSDLHLGKRVNEFSMIEDQKYILKRITDIALEERPDAVLIAGDVYDKSVPTVEAVELFDDFLCRLSELKLKTFVISGNHDSGERLSFGSRLMEHSGVFICGERAESFRLTDEYGEVGLVLLPYMRPQAEQIAEAIAGVGDGTVGRRVLLAHQFVVGAEISDDGSEIFGVGGLDAVPASLFDGFDYVALGHIHKPQNLVGGRMRYCGTPLKYSFGEVGQEKSVTLVELGEKGGEPSVSTVPLKPLHDMRRLRGSYEELMLKENYEGTDLDDYIHITLTDEEDVLDAFRKLQTVYRNLMHIEYDNRRTSERQTVGASTAAVKKTPMEYFEELFLLQNNKEMSEEQKELVSGISAQIWK